LFWVPEGCFPDVPSLAEAVNSPAAGYHVTLTKVQMPATADLIGDADGNPPLFVAHMSPGKLVGDSLLVATGDNYVAGNIQALHGAEDPVNHWVLRRCRYRRQMRVPGVTALLAAGAGSNYYHWLFESLPRLLLLERAGYGLDQIDHFLLSETQQPFHAQTLDLLRIPGEKRWRGRKARVLKCDHLLVPSLPAPATVFPSWVLSFLRRSFLPAAELVTEGQRLFISRRRANRRRLVNETEVEDQLRRAGFKTVCLEDCSFTEQVGLFASASAIVAVHGAGLANLVFARPGTKVVEWVVPTYINHYYPRLARALRLTYIEGIGVVAGSPRKRSGEDDLYLPPADLRKALEQIGL
jgi:capsular polysaccharide biosynthesis protein